MPGPDPEGIEIGDGWPDRVSVLFYHFAHWPGVWGGGNRQHRAARANAVASNLRKGGWCCIWCGDEVPLFRRTDAVYCSTGCRKRAARARKMLGFRDHGNT